MSALFFRVNEGDRKLLKKDDGLRPAQRHTARHATTGQTLTRSIGPTLQGDSSCEKPFYFCY